MKILAIRFARLGDVILLLPALALLKEKFPDSELTLLTGHRCAPIAELCPAIDHVISVDRIAMRDGSVSNATLEMIRLVRDIRRRRFDLVVDFHGFRETNLLTRLSGAPRRIGMKRHKASFLSFCFNLPPVQEDKSLHVAQMFRKIVAALPHSGNPSAIGENMNTTPQTRFSTFGRLVTQKAKEPTIALFVDAPVPERVWPPERFAQVADFAVERLRARIVVLASKEKAELAMRVQTASRHAGRISVFTDMSLVRLAAIIASAHLLVSNDTGPMHIGPAVGIPTLGLFSVGLPKHFRPTGEGDGYLQANPIEGIEVGDVIQAVEQMWAIAGRDLPR